MLFASAEITWLFNKFCTSLINSHGTLQFACSYTSKITFRRAFMSYLIMHVCILLPSNPPSFINQKFISIYGTAMNCILWFCPCDLVMTIMRNCFPIVVCYGRLHLFWSLWFLYMSFPKISSLKEVLDCLLQGCHNRFHVFWRHVLLF